jgi:signal peptidase I
LALAAALGLALALAVRAFLLGIFRVSSDSMLPLIAKGDRVLVWFERAPALERFELAVLQRPGDDAPIVKRVAGLPGESVQLVGGDLLVDGRRVCGGLEGDAARLPLTPLFDQGRLPLAEWFWLDPDGPWRIEEGGAAARVDARMIESAAHEDRLHYHRHLDDGWLEPDGYEPGTSAVNDGAIECRVRFESPEPGARFLLELSEEGDEFEASLEILAGGLARLAVVRRAEDGSQPAEVMLESSVAVDPTVECALAFSNVDNALEFRVECSSGVYAQRAAYEWNRPRAEGRSRAAGGRAALGAERGAAVARGIRVLRDAWWKPHGVFAVEQALVLGPDEVFVLGDRSASSVDSRLWGPVALDDVLGVPVALVWPPRRWRDL